MDFTLLTLAIVLVITGAALALQALGLVDVPELLGALAGAISALAFRLRSEKKKERKKNTATKNAAIALFMLAPLLAHCAAGDGARWKAAGTAYGTCVAQAALACAPHLYPPPVALSPALALPNPPPKCHTTDAGPSSPDADSSSSSTEDAGPAPSDAEPTS